MKILHIDNHAIFRAGIKNILKPLDTTIEFLEASDLQTALTVISSHQDIDLLLIDLSLPDSDELNHLKNLRCHIPTTPAVVLTAFQDPIHIKTALKVGLAGYIPKSATSTTLISALRVVLEGGRYTPRVATLHPIPGKIISPVHLSHKLTKRQREVLSLMADGLPNKTIACKLFISEATVKGHVTAILMTLGVNNRVQAINRWQETENGLKLAS
jgi:DNA-binding NarL/FixJ family response regulator